MPPSPRVRFAPSPTGHLHIGGARTAIYNWAFARHQGGTFVLRIEDTDPERSTRENTDAIIRAMEWLGLDFDEGPGVGGPYGPYFQTQRTQTYVEALDRLKRAGAAYPCFCTPEVLEAKRTTARERGGFAGYDRTCRTLDPDEAHQRIARGEPHVWRLKVPLDRGDIVFNDAVRGEVVFQSSQVDDLVLVRTDSTPTYNFAVTIDDATMRISHVIRGDDHLSNTPKQILIYEALGEPIPTFAHLSMIWGPDGKRLSKRHGATSVEAYREQGYLPEALVNYLALLGWSLDGETTIFSREVLKEHFSLERVSRNPAIFDVEKLDWINGTYLREMSPSDFAQHMMPWLQDAGLTTIDDYATRPDWYHTLAPRVAERVKRLCDAPALVEFLFRDTIELEPSSVSKALLSGDARSALRAAQAALTSLEVWRSQEIETCLRGLAERLAVKPKIVFQAVRVAVTGSVVSLPLFESLELLGQDRTAERIRAALEALDSDRNPADAASEPYAR
ncbi:MAG: glutamate--tRNA ligase [Actinomycetia bacterium]|nr:glutamate--tRNA ligase [Actinomycetes bacterium]